MQNIANNSRGKELDKKNESRFDQCTQGKYNNKVEVEWSSSKVNSPN